MQLTKRENGLLELRLRGTWAVTLTGSSYNFRNQVSRGLHFKINLLLEGASDPSRIRTLHVYDLPRRA